MDKKIVAFKILKNIPGAKKGEVIKLSELKYPKTSNGALIKGCSIGGKYWFESEMLNFNEFFKPIYDGEL